jgi:hypothetical protein
MKRYNLTPNGAQVDENGVWVRAEDAKRLLDALMAQVELSEYWINLCRDEIEIRHGPMSDNDYRVWLATGHKYGIMRTSIESVRASASIASCSLPTTDDQD